MFASNREFQQAALLVTHGDVPDNHSYNLAKVLGYDTIVVAADNDLEDALPTLTMPSAAEGVGFAARQEREKHIAQRGKWLRQWVADTHRLEPHDYDVHLVHNSTAENFRGTLTEDNVKGILSYVACNSLDSMGAPLVEWAYKPFDGNSGPGAALLKKQLGGDLGGVDPFHPLLDFMSQHPKPYKFAAATAYPSKRGTVRSITATFAYPTRAEITRVVEHPEEINAQGERILSRTEVAVRSYSPDIPPTAQMVIDQINAERDATISDGIQDDLNFFESSGGGDFADLRAARLLAPIYNLL